MKQEEATVHPSAFNGAPVLPQAARLLPCPHLVGGSMTHKQRRPELTLR